MKIANDNRLSSIVAGTIPLDVNRVWLVQQIQDLEEALEAWEASQ